MRLIVYLFSITFLLTSCKPKPVSEENIEVIPIFLGFKLGSTKADVKKHIDSLLTQQIIERYSKNGDTLYKFAISKSESDSLIASFSIRNQFEEDKLASLSFYYTYIGRIGLNEVPKGFLLNALTNKYGEPSLQPDYQLFPINVEYNWSFNHYKIIYKIYHPLIRSKPKFFGQHKIKSYNFDDLGEIMVQVSYMHHYLKSQMEQKHDRLDSIRQDSTESAERIKLEKSAEAL